jgi:hypothetical protein
VTSQVEVTTPRRCLYLNTLICEKMLPCTEPSTLHVHFAGSTSRAMAGSAAIFGVSAPPAIWSCPILRRFLRDGGRICRPFHSECLLSFCGPEHSGVFALIAFELVCDPEQRAKDGGAVVAGQVHNTGLTTRRPVRSGAACACGARLATRAYHAAPLPPVDGYAPPGCA